MLARCSRCPETDPGAFTKCRRSPTGLSWWCKACRKKYRQGQYLKNRQSELNRNKQWREAHPEKMRAYSNKHRAQNPDRKRAQDRAAKLVREYGITSEQFEEMKNQQNGHCAICGQVPTNGLHVDHSHETERVRELLCGNCNRALGLLHDDPNIFIQAAIYLNKHGKTSTDNRQ